MWGQPPSAVPGRQAPSFSDAAVAQQSRAPLDGQPGRLPPHDFSSDFKLRRCLLPYNCDS